MISFIWAMDQNRVIGKNNQLPWHLPADLKFFKRVTMGHPIAMGRKTYESIGRPLPGRENIIITRNKNYQNDKVTILHSTEDLLTFDQTHKKEIFVIGGAEIFKEMLSVAKRLYLTKIHEEFEGDTYFPELCMDDWKLISHEKGIKDEKNPYDFEFCIYERKSK